MTDNEATTTMHESEADAESLIPFTLWISQNKITSIECSTKTFISFTLPYCIIVWLHFANQFLLMITMMMMMMNKGSVKIQGFIVPSDTSEKAGSDVVTLTGGTWDVMCSCGIEAQDLLSPNVLSHLSPSPSATDHIDNPITDLCCRVHKESVKLHNEIRPNNQFKNKLCLHSSG